MNKTDDLSINLNTLDEKGVYEAFHVEGNEAEALTDSYFELYQLLGAEAMLKLYKHYQDRLPYEALPCGICRRPRKAIHRKEAAG